MTSPGGEHCRSSRPILLHGRRFKNTHRDRVAGWDSPPVGTAGCMSRDGERRREVLKELLWFVMTAIAFMIVVGGPLWLYYSY